MPDLLAPVLDPEQGDRLTRPAYKQEFRQREDAIRDGSSWKLERRQHFEEQGSPSRDALRRGDWEEALRLLADRRDSLAAAAQEEKSRGYAFHRVRVVEKPLTPYVQWELHSQRQRAEHGQRIRIVRAEQVAASESTGPLPEMVVLGGRALFQVLYTEAGVANGAIRYTDPDLVERWENYIKALYAAGEDVIPYFDREVAHLDPPKLSAEGE
ncbi:DUF6879 family protein [Streptomyces sp. NPDC007983]|uniref:DUF6879 family protein n=1 Tax=Streptomyces sp. NPDC007983 TaxID=3364800 RepID=UPI0036E7A513